MSELVDSLLWQIKAAKLPQPQTEVRVTSLRRFRFDLAWPDRKIAAEVDGGSWVAGRHSRGKGFASDCVKSCEAACGGWVVLHFTGAMVESGEALNYLERVLA